MSSLLPLLACLPLLGAAACPDARSSKTDCARQSYASTSAASADACCALCASESECTQWTFHSMTGKCSRTKENEDPHKSITTIFSTCGVKAPSPPPSPPGPPAPPSPPPSPGMASTWAVIAAGSAGYMNYRHQADACHAYQILSKSGIAADHIILMMQDDVANSMENPFPGKLFNRMGDDVPDVYAGCNVDYRGKVVTAELFMKVLTGDVSAGGKVLKSGPQDRVFVNFIDHGGVGIIAFPNGPTLHAMQLSQTLQTMQQKHMFNELVFYMEACESGSMFPNLTPDGKIFAVTAANAKESSWGYYCAPKNDTANGKHLKTCLGDLFSIAWMEDADLGQLSSESFRTQVQRVTARTIKSHVTIFGDKSFEDEHIGDFESALAGKIDLQPMDLVGGAVDAREIHLHYYQSLWREAVNATEKAIAWKHLQKALTDREADVRTFSQIAVKACEGEKIKDCASRMSKTKMEMKNMQCHQALVDIVYSSCPKRATDEPGGWNSFNMQFSQILVNLCESSAGLDKNTEALSKIVQQECAEASHAAQLEIVV